MRRHGRGSIVIREPALQDCRFLEPKVRGRTRWAAEILADFGDLECPTRDIPAAALMREARKALGWTMHEASWRLGFERSNADRISKIETGQKLPPRFVRLLMVQALQELAQQQRTMARPGRVR